MAGSPAFRTVSNDRGCAFAVTPGKTQIVRSYKFGVFQFKVLWSNKIGKNDLRRTYGRAVSSFYQITHTRPKLCNDKVIEL